MTFFVAALAPQHHPSDNTMLVHGIMWDAVPKPSVQGLINRQRITLGGFPWGNLRGPTRWGLISRWYRKPWIFGRENFMGPGFWPFWKNISQNSESVFFGGWAVVVDVSAFLSITPNWCQQWWWLMQLGTLSFSWRIGRSRHHGIWRFAQRVSP